MLTVMSVRLYPSEAQESRLFDYLRCGRRVWNHFLEHRIKAYKRRKESVSFYDQCRMLTTWRANDPEIAAIPLEVQRDALRRLDRAFQAFFRRCKAGESKVGFPRFKGANRWNSFELNGQAKHAQNDRIRVYGIDLIRCHNLRPIEGQQRSLRIVRRADRWFAQILIEDGTTAPAKRPIESAIGLDLGLTNFVVGSDGAAVPAPKHFRRLERKLKRACRAVNRKRKGSRNRRKAVRRLQRIHLRIADARWNFTHHLSKFHVSRYDLIAVENLNISGMVRSHFGKSILDAAWGQFLWQLTYKAEKAGVSIVRVKPQGTSQDCSQCGEAVPKSLSIRIHRCPSCGLVMDRDHNAARNILARAFDTVSIPPVGRKFTPVESRVADSPKQEVQTKTLPSPSVGSS